LHLALLAGGLGEGLAFEVWVFGVRDQVEFGLVRFLVLYRSLFVEGIFDVDCLFIDVEDWFGVWSWFF